MPPHGTRRSNTPQSMFYVVKRNNCTHHRMANFYCSRMANIIKMKTFIQKKKKNPIKRPFVTLKKRVHSVLDGAKNVEEKFL